MSKNDGGPAFPIQPITDSHGRFLVVPNNGMSLRDYFAAAAMNGLLAAGRDPQFIADTMEEMALSCYRIADTMLAERDK